MKRVLLIFLFIIAFTVNVRGEDTVSVESFNFYSLEDMVEDKTDLSFTGLLEDLLDGKGIFSILKERATDIIKNEIFYNNRYIKAIIVISIISAVINIVGADIKDKSVYELVSFIGQVMIIGIAAASFKNSINMLQKSISDITDIVNSAIPFMIMLLTASGKGASIAGGGIMAIGTEITGAAVNTLIVPVLVIATLLKIINILSKKQLLDKLSDLFMRITSLGLKGCAYTFVFLITIERISGGIINRSLGSSVKSVIKMIPVVGDVLGGVSDAAAGTISAVSSGVGIILMAVIIFAVMVPLFEIAAAALLYKLIAAVLEPVCDKQTIEIIDTIGESNFMILSALFIISAMFVVACAIVLCGVT